VVSTHCCFTFSIFDIDAPPTATSPLSLHDALPISMIAWVSPVRIVSVTPLRIGVVPASVSTVTWRSRISRTDMRASSFRLLFSRSEEHTSELQSRENLVCRLLLEKKKEKKERITKA